MDQPNICHLLEGVFKNFIKSMGELSFFGFSFYDQGFASVPPWQLPFSSPQ